MNNEIEHLKKQASIILNLYNAKNYEDVISKGKILISKYPNQLIFYNAVCLSLSALGDNKEALKIIDEALKLTSNDINVLNNAGLINFNLGKMREAEDFFNRALKIVKNFPDALINLGNLKLKEGKAKEAEVYFNNAIKYNKMPAKNEIIYMALGNYYMQLGEFEKAKNFFVEFNKINKTNTMADKSISLMHKYSKKDDPHLKSMEEKLKIVKSTKNSTYLIKEHGAYLLHFALGKAYEDLGEYKKSFEHLLIGNKLYKENLNYTFKKDENMFLSLAKIFKDDIPETLRSHKKIIFVVGMPRSGTTLTEQIISSHPKVHGAGELNYLTEGINQYLMKENEFSIQKIKEVNIDKLKLIQKDYLDKLDKLGFHEECVVDKAPLNFRWIGFIKMIFPNSKIVHCNRDSMDICFSNFKNFFPAKTMSFTYDLADLGEYYKMYKNLMKLWLSKSNIDIYNLSYENLVNNQEIETKKLINYLELEWDKICLSPHKNKKVVATASLAQVRNPVYKSSMKKWQNYSEELKDLQNLIEKI